MNKLLALVVAMHVKFGITNDEIPNFSEEERNFRITAMQEELDEYIVAGTAEDELDALVDLAVFTLGTIERMGHADNFDEAYRRVMEKNMEKELGPNQKRNSFQLDLVKPEGWVPADLSDLV